MPVRAGAVAVLGSIQRRGCALRTLAVYVVLAQHFVERFAARSGKTVRGITTAAAEKLVTYEWPGNVRELENCL